jgi:hypothetical protein
MRNLTGMKFGRLTVIEYSHKEGSYRFWKCQCDCGNVRIVKADNLASGNSQSCGKHKIKDIIGNKYGRLTVVSYAYSKARKVYYNCKCECGKEKVVRSDSLKDGTVKSCGCLNYEAKSVKHNMTGTKLYHVWASMRDRCNNPNDAKYEYYGGKGITVNSNWDADFQSFYNWAIINGYKEGLTIDRRDVNGNYEPDNCRWITQQEQSNNTTRNRNITYNEKTQNITQWSKELGINRNTLNARLNNGWDIERAFNLKHI